MCSEPKGQFCFVLQVRKVETFKFYELLTAEFCKQMSAANQITRDLWRRIGDHPIKLHENLCNEIHRKEDDMLIHLPEHKEDQLMLIF